MKKMVSVEKYQSGVLRSERDEVVVESELTLKVNGKRYHLMCSPECHKELALGFMYNGGLISGLQDIREIVEQDNFMRVTLDGDSEASHRQVRTSGCLGMGIESNREIRRNDFRMNIAADEVHRLSEKLNANSGLFRETGGTHASLAVLDDGSELYFEDIGRHNTFDKLVGGAILKGKSLEKSIIVTTGRISSEMVIKAARNRVGILISRSAPTDLAVELAEGHGILLIGFARSKRFNRYSLIDKKNDDIIE